MSWIRIPWRLESEMSVVEKFWILGIKEPGQMQLPAAGE
jgi:hypothetical protein